MTFVCQMLVQGAVGFAIGAGTNELAIRWVFNTLFTKKKRLIAAPIGQCSFPLTAITPKTC